MWLAAALACASVAPAQAPDAPPAAWAPARRVLVYHIEGPDLSERQRGMLGAALLTEIRRLAGFTAVSAGRARHQATLGDPEARRRCLESLACLRDAIESIGADLLVHGTITPDGAGGWVFRLARLDADGTEAAAERGVTAAGTHRPGDELMPMVPTLVGQLFPGVPAAPPEVTDELPPVVTAYSDSWLLPPWVFGIGAALTVGSAIAVVFVGTEMAAAESRFNQLAGSREVVAGEELARLARRAYDLADAANALAWSAGGLFVATLAVAFFTDFTPSLEVQVEVMPPAAGPTGGAGLGVRGRF